VEQELEGPELGFTSTKDFTSTKVQILTPGEQELEGPEYLQHAPAGEPYELKPTMLTGG
jgi:hypothetical protein